MLLGCVVMNEIDACDLRNHPPRRHRRRRRPHRRPSPLQPVDCRCPRSMDSLCRAARYHRIYSMNSDHTHCPPLLRSQRQPSPPRSVDSPFHHLIKPSFGRSNCVPIRCRMRRTGIPRAVSIEIRCQPPHCLLLYEQSKLKRNSQLLLPLLQRLPPLQAVVHPLLQLPRSFPHRFQSRPQIIRRYVFSRCS